MHGKKCANETQATTATFLVDLLSTCFSQRDRMCCRPALALGPNVGPLNKASYQHAHVEPMWDPYSQIGPYRALHIVPIMCSWA